MSSNILPPLTTLTDDVDANTTYVGETTPGVAVTVAGWRIKKISKSGTITTVAWASREFDQIWNNRASLTYT